MIQVKNVSDQIQCICGYWQTPLNYCPNCGKKIEEPKVTTSPNTFTYRYVPVVYVYCAACHQYHQSGAPCYPENNTACYTAQAAK